MKTIRSMLRFLSPYDRIRLLQSVSFFEALDAEDLAALADHAEEEHRRRGSHLIEPGRPADAVRVLVEGEALMRRHGAVVRRIGPGCPIGFITVLGEDDDRTEVVTTTRTLSLMLKRSIWLGLLEDRFSILHHVLRATARQLREECVVSALLPEPSADAGPEVSVPIGEVFDRFLFLRDRLPFGRRDLFGLWHLARRTTVVRFEAGETLFRAGAPSSEMILLSAGHVRCQLTGSELCLGPGHEIGIVDALAEEARSYTAVADTPVEGLRIDREELLDMFEDHFEVALDWLATSSRMALDAMETRAAAADEVPSGFGRMS